MTRADMLVLPALALMVRLVTFTITMHTRSITTF